MLLVDYLKSIEEELEEAFVKPEILEGLIIDRLILSFEQLGLLYELGEISLCYLNAERNPQAFGPFYQQ